MFDTFVSDAYAQERQRQVTQELMRKQLVREAVAQRRAEVRAARERLKCLIRSVLHEVLPSGVARLFAPPCTPACCAPRLAA